MDEVALDSGQDLLDQEEYHIDLSAPGLNTDELDLGIEDLMGQKSGDAAQPEAEESPPVLEEIGYDEELQGDDNPDETNPDASTSHLLGDGDGADAEEAEIEYEDDSLPVDAPDVASGDNPDTDLIGSPGAGAALDLALDEAGQTDYDDHNGEAFGYLDLQTANLKAHGDELDNGFAGALSTTEDSKYEPSGLQEGDDYDTRGEEHVDADHEDDEDFEAAKRDDAALLSDFPDVTVQYNRVRYSLFGGPRDHADDYFLTDVRVLDQPLSQLFSSLRAIIMDEILPTDELLIRIDKLDGLEFREQSTTSFLNHTFREILDVYYRLLSNDGLREDRLHISLLVVPDSEDVFARFVTAAEEGHGLSELAVSGRVFALKQADDPVGNEDGHVDAEDDEPEEDAALTKYTEQYMERDEVTANRDVDKIEAGGEPTPFDFIPDGEDFPESYPSENNTDNQEDDFSQLHAFERDGSRPYDGDGSPQGDGEELGQDDEATAVGHSNDGVDYPGGTEDADGTVPNDDLDYVANPDSELEGADDVSAADDNGDGEYDVEIENLGDESLLAHEIGLAVEIDGSPTNLTQEQTASAVAIGGNLSAQTSATSTLNGEEIAYDEHDGPLEQAVISDPAGFASNGHDGTLDEIDWQNGDEEENAGSNALETTPQSASGKRMRQADDEFASLADEGADNKRRRI